MDERSLLDVFAALRGSPDAALALPDLPADLLGEALSNYADVAPPEVAEHLGPAFLDGLDPADALTLLTTAPGVTWEDEVADAELPPLPEETEDPFALDPFDHDPLTDTLLPEDPVADPFDTDPGDDWLDL